MKYLALAGLVGLLGGCATNIAPPLSANAAPSAANGVIAGQFSRDASTGVAFIVHNTQTGVDYPMSLGDASAGTKPGDPQVVAIEVPPGEYAILKWEAFGTLTKKLYGEFDMTIVPLTKPFTVRAGQATFLGGFFVVSAETYSTQMNHVGADVTRHWNIATQRLPDHDARMSFAGAYPAYSHSEFACLMCAEQLAGATTRVKDVVADSQAYLSGHFSPNAVSPEVVNMITASDNEPVHFSHIVMHLTWHYNVNDASRASSGDEVRTLDSAGGPFVATLSKRSKNGTPVAQTFALTYRNMFELKNQWLDLSQEFVTPPTEMGLVQRFDPLSSLGAGAQYSFTVGTRTPVNKFSPASASCTSEGKLDASTVAASLRGEAINVACSYYNSNSQLTSKSRFIYLPQYGVVVPLSVQSARGRSEATLTAISVQ